MLPPDVFHGLLYPGHAAVALFRSGVGLGAFGTSGDDLVEARMEVVGVDDGDLEEGTAARGKGGEEEERDEEESAAAAALLHLAVRLRLTLLLSADGGGGGGDAEASFSNGPLRRQERLRQARDGYRAAEARVYLFHLLIDFVDCVAAAAACRYLSRGRRCHWRVPGRLSSCDIHYLAAAKRINTARHGVCKDLS